MELAYKEAAEAVKAAAERVGRTPPINIENVQPAVAVQLPDVKVEVPDVKVDVQERDIMVVKQDAPQVTVQAPDIKFPEQEPSNVQVDVHVPEQPPQPAPQVDVHLPDQEVNVHLEAELKQPDQVIETETMIERDRSGLITRTIKTSRNIIDRLTGRNRD
jgi:hypothetical protein